MTLYVAVLGGGRWCTDGLATHQPTPSQSGGLVRCSRCGAHLTIAVTSGTPFCLAPSPSSKSTCYLNRGHFEPSHYAPCPDHGDWCTDHPAEEWPRSPLVLNIHSDPPVAVSAGVYIGRPSIWGNPFQIGRDGDRAQVISKYRRWLQKQPDLIERMKRELRGKDLVCFCAPLMCHGDVILEVANS